MSPLPVNLSWKSLRGVGLRRLMMTCFFFEMNYLGEDGVCVCVCVHVFKLNKTATIVKCMRQVVLFVNYLLPGKVSDFETSTEFLASKGDIPLQISTH